MVGPSQPGDAAPRKGRSRISEFGGAVLVAVLGLALSLLAYVYLRDQDQTARAEALERQASQHLYALTSRVDRHLLLLNGFAGLFADPHGVQRGQYRDYAAKTLGFFRSVNAIAWVPLIRRDFIPKLEASAVADGITGFRVHRPGDPAPDGMAGPMMFVEPRTGLNETVVGADIWAQEDRRNPMILARDTGAIVASPPLRLLISTPDSPPNFLMFAPVYQNGATPANTEERRASIAGFIAAALRADRFFDTAFAGLALDGADLYIADESAPLGQRLLFFHRGLRTLGNEAPLTEEALYAAPHLRRTMDVGGRQWALLFRLREMPQPLGAIGVLMGGLLVTMFMAAFVHANTARSRRSEELAASMGRANATLEAEIAQRREIERALRETDSRLRLALASAPISLYCYDRDLRYTWILKSRIGLTAEEAVGRTDVELMGEEGREIDEIKRRIIDTGEPFVGEVAFTFRDNDYILDVRLEPMRDDAGAVVGLVGTAIDLTEERLAQALLAEARAEAERANEAKSRFLASASHDLRQPLQATRLFLEVLLLKLEGREAREVAEKAVESLEASESLLETLLDVSTLEAGVVMAHPVNFPIQRLLDQIAREGAPQAEEQGLGLTVVPCSAVVRSDPVLLQRMIRNLMTNALRYTREGRILIGCRRHGDVLRIVVGDTGPGIPPDKLEEIFRDFYQIDGNSPESRRGLGLGLSIVDRMARLLGHRVEVRSVLGRGSAFTIEVPVAGWQAHARRSEPV